MICEIRDADDTVVERYELEPTCGEDFCASCGDCLSCYGSDPCPDRPSKGHLWALYLDFDAAYIEGVRAAGKKVD